MAAARPFAALGDIVDGGERERRPTKRSHCSSQWACPCKLPSWGILFVVLGAFFFSFGNSLVSHLAKKGVSSWLVIVFRGCFTLLSNLSLVAFSDGRVGVRRAILGLPKGSAASTPAEPWWRSATKVYGRGCLACLSSFTLIFVFTSGNATFADAFAIFLGVTTSGAIVLAALLLRERPTRSVIVGGCISLCGVVFVGKPESIFGHRAGSPNYSPPTALGLVCLALSGLSCGAYFISTKALRNRSPQTLLHGYMTMMFLAGVCCFCAIDGGNVWAALPHTTVDVTLLVFYALIQQAGQIFHAKGFARAPAGLGAVLANTEVLFAFVLDAMFLGEDVDIFSLLGAGIVFVGAICAARGSTSDDEIEKMDDTSPLDVRWTSTSSSSTTSTTTSTTLLVGQVELIEMCPIGIVTGLQGAAGASVVV